MLSITLLLSLLLPAVNGDSTVQQDLLCTDSYVEFERASIGSNNSGENLRNQLYEIFYAPNQHFPYSVIVNYQLILANGSRLNLSSADNCSSELWKWESSPVFLIGDSTYLNRLLLFTLNYFMEWEPPHITITTATAPCHAKMRDFLNEMTASLQDYALGQMEYKTNLGYVRRGCGPFTSRNQFTAVGKAKIATTVIYVLKLSGLFFQIVFVWIVSAVLLKMTFKEYAQKTFTYSFDIYGMFWGVSTTAVGLMGVLCGIYIATVLLYINTHKNADGPSIYIPLGALFLVLVVELPVAIYTARKATVAVPCTFKYPAILLCCGKKKRAECLVTTTVLWVNLVALQLISFHGALIAFTIFAAPFAIVTNVMAIVLALSCLTNFFSLLYTSLAHFCTPSNQRVHSSSMVLRAVVVLPLLLMIMCYGFVFAAMGSATNEDAKRDNILSFISSIVTPILLGVISVFLKRFISTWLKWSPEGTGEANDTSQGQEIDEELLHVGLINDEV